MTDAASATAPSRLPAAGIDLRGVVKRFGVRRALRGLDLEHSRRRVLLLARTLRLRQDHHAEPDRRVRRASTEGEIWISAAGASTCPLRQRPVNTVFQYYALFPHISVLENLGFGLRMDHVPRDACDGAGGR